MAYKHVQKFISLANCASTRKGMIHLNVMLYHCRSEPSEEKLSYEWYEKAFPKMKKLSYLLKDVDLIDGCLVNIKDDSMIFDPHIQQKMHTFKSIVRVFIGSPLLQQILQKDAVVFSDGAKNNIISSFSKPCEREPMVVNSLNKVADFLNISSQKRKLVRATVSPQVTQHRIWSGALMEILNGLKAEMDCLNYGYSDEGSNMAQQIVSGCLKFLAENDIGHDPDSTSWMRLTPSKVFDYSASSKWEDVLDMFNDLIVCLEGEMGLFYHVAKLKVMKEGLSQIKGIMVEKGIGYKDARYQGILVRKKLSKTLGHSSRCLFTLLLYYLYGCVRDIEVDVCGSIYGCGNEDRFSLCMGRILTSEDDKMLWGGVKQLSRALQLFKFVWETAEMKGALDLQGHLWCVGAEERSVTYRGTTFFVHGINI
ncbi:hypothetical protein HS088_TW23G00976 [Tripterygium wilfordii]|uniref:Uncharacterized protein n=1 Tax=Tripterygium wilfordii TaxID=458696 RepID=A0A7J7BWH9_TRIWF|nr:uncharacterized protein LOC119992476 [Tripterygium wilfordii]XP_038695111.1 uncharacterized protein LOC119992476 [Tripterygium wilfordii]XP_038695112.1 uncharacterized protein LOC119992476 [Tripterygium wilfordii]KAF5726234.1 hypothetical protein HS088_TW23G00976 [Tripterygium wilfordii]